MNPPCPHRADIEAYLDARADAPSTGILDDDAYEELLAHLAECASCRQAFVGGVTWIKAKDRLMEEEPRWAVGAGIDAAAAVRAGAALGEVEVPLEAADAGPTPSLAATETLRRLRAIVVEGTRLLRFTVSTPPQLVFVGTRGGADRIAPQSFAFRLDELAAGGWEPDATAWVSPRDILIKLTPTKAGRPVRHPRFAFRSVSQGVVWLEEPSAAEELEDGAYLFHAWRLDPSRPTHAQVALPLDGYVWFPGE